MEDWKICFIPLLNPDGYEIYEKDFYAIRNPIYRQMLRMQEIPCKEFICNSRGVNLRKNFPTQYYRRKQIHSQPASENETKALIKVFQENTGRGLLSFGYSERQIVYFRQSQSFAANQKSYAEICRQPAFRIEIPRRSGENEMVPDPAEYEELHTLPLEYLFSL